MVGWAGWVGCERSCGGGEGNLELFVHYSECLGSRGGKQIPERTNFG